MNSPDSLTLIRHAESAYNALSVIKEGHLYQEFRRSFECDSLSVRTQKLALKLREQLSLDYSDRDTPLTQESGIQAAEMARRLKSLIVLPDVIFVSPYMRTKQTLEYMRMGWPALNNIKTVEDDRIREKQYGQFSEFNDWYVMYTFHPEQKVLFEEQGKYHYRPPGGENIDEVKARTQLWLEHLNNQHKGRKVLAVTHHLTILAVRALLEDLSEEQFMELDDHQRPTNCSVTIYRAGLEDSNDRLQLEIYNADLTRLQ